MFFAPSSRGTCSDNQISNKQFMYIYIFFFPIRQAVIRFMVRCTLWAVVSQVNTSTILAVVASVSLG